MSGGDKKMCKKSEAALSLALFQELEEGFGEQEISEKVEVKEVGKVKPLTFRRQL